MSDHYDPDIQQQRDYEALNADTRKQLSAALKLIAELEEKVEIEEAAYDMLAEGFRDLESENERLRDQVVELKACLTLWQDTAANDDV